MELHGKVALVTGGARRVGRAIALELARQGASIALHHHQAIEAAGATAAEIKALGVEVATIGADLADPAEIDVLAQAVVERFGGVDLLVNSAAIYFRSPVGEVTAADWDRLHALNLRAPFLLTQALASTLRERHGRVVMITDIGGERPWPGYLPYGASKAGLIYLTRGFAKVLAPEVLVNAVSPGTVLPPESASAEDIAAEVRRTALKRLPAPEDVARAVAFLCAADAITGQVLAVESGKLLG
ncbi:MAG TPA: SDR family oxidoreductase [Candidatus Udaeobacter sp.]|nr:SDR family oxidoreductase [Candidatus Udaeobacter sp.]